MTIEPKITKNVDDKIERAIERAQQASDKRMEKYMDSISSENKHHMEALKEAFHDEVQLVIEVLQERPTRDEVRTITREEMDDSLRPVNAKLDYLNEERKQMLEAIEDIKA